MYRNLDALIICLRDDAPIPVRFPGLGMLIFLSQVFHSDTTSCLSASHARHPTSFLALLCQLSLNPSCWQDSRFYPFLTRIATELLVRPVRFPLIGEYGDVFTGDGFVYWLHESLGGNLRCAE